MQPRYESTIAEGADSVAVGDLQAAGGRLAVFPGPAGPSKLTYRFSSRWPLGAPALDYFVDYELRRRSRARGQDKFYFTRVWWASDSSIDIFERPAAVDLLRYDRDIGLWAHGELLDGRSITTLTVQRAGPNQRNDNIDVASLVARRGRLAGRALQRFPPGT